jgi:hypothetical protein
MSSSCPPSTSRHNPAQLDPGTAETQSPSAAGTAPAAPTLRDQLTAGEPVAEPATPPGVDPGLWGRFAGQVVVLPGGGPGAGCHLWLGRPRDDGYGQFWLPGGRVIRAHRFAWAAWHGPVRPGVVIRHQCDEPLCTPITRAAVDQHLAAGTQADNVVDRELRGRGYRRRGGVRGWTVDRRGMAARSRAVHEALHAALAAGASPVDLVAVLAQVRAEGASSAGQLPLDL